MSRKSRIITTTLKNTNNNKGLSVAGYVRLSVAKDNCPGDSIESQSNIIKEYINSHSNMKLHKIYIDKNASGSTFDRKGFKEMINDIENAEVNCVMVKDLSRLGRDSISVGYYIQQIFPSKGIRFISIDDKFDTVDGITNIGDPSKPISEIPIIAIVDEYYSKDISKKVQSTIDSNIQAGKFVAPRAPFGYTKSETDCHKLVVDEDAAYVVREIFQLAYNQYGLTKIVKYLNQRKYLTPINYAISKGLKGNYDCGNGLWNTRTVKNILTNKVYIGDLEQGKEKYLVKNTHEAIIDRDIFNIIQNIFHNNQKSNMQMHQPSSDNIFKGKVVCGDCGAKMQRRKRTNKKEEYYYFSCIANSRNGMDECNGMYIKESNIYNAIDNAVKDFMANNKYQDLINGQKDVIQKIKCLKNQFTAMDDVKHNYEEYITGKISDAEYKSLNTRKNAIKNDIHKFETELAKVIDKIKAYEVFETLSYENIVNLYVNKIIVCSNKSAEVMFNEKIY